MKIKGSISILVNKETTTIQVHDEQAVIQFLEIELTAEQFCAALGRFSRVKCELDLRSVDNIGKQHENKYFEFEIPNNLKSSKHTDALHEIAQTLLDEQGEGWVADNHFASQNTFFTKDGKDHARCTVRRWS